jgi:hypothetical protein
MRCGHCRSHEIWKDEGYNVYGLTPTGKAAQNLEQSGIESTTLHKFLKSYEAGRCQYGEKSVLVLDEAGMVDMERFGKLLGAVKELGVKLIVVGDGAQLQPVEAGPAFRLVTTRLGKVELNTVLRQKEEWQREATVLFGRQETKEAIQTYADKGHVHIVEEELPSSDPVKLYEVSHRVSSLMYREMAREVSQENPETSKHYSFIRNHQDFERYAYWKGIERKAALSIFENAEAVRPVLEERCLDPLNIALVLADKFQSKEAQREEAKERLKECKLDHLIGIQKPAGTGVEVREQAKEALIQSWHRTFSHSPEKNLVMLAYSNRDVNNLNQSARSLLKESDHIAKEEFTYTIKREVEDDFGRKRILKEEKGFSKGDRIVFTRANYWLGVKNGTMGTITNLDQNKVNVKLDEGKELSFSPNLKPYFDQGWAITIHKSQGTTVDRTYVLASYEMTQNLAYVAMTRHREDVQVFGSSLDFWRNEKLPQVLAKSGEKLSAADYLDAESLDNLMQDKDNLLTKIFDRVSNELEAMGAVTKQAFWSVADHFLGIKKEKEIRVLPEGIREEVRAGELLQQKSQNPTLEAIYEEMKHSAFANATIVKAAFEKGLKAQGEEKAIAYWEERKQDFLRPYQENLAKVETELSSPLLSRFTDQWKDQAHTFAQQDPARVLGMLIKVKTREAAHYERIAVEEKARQEKIIAEERAVKEQQAHREHIKGTYLRFQSLYDMVKDTRHIPEAFKEDLKKFSKVIAQDHTFMSNLKLRDSEEAEKIKHIAQGKEIEEHMRSMDRGRGGFSL